MRLIDADKILEVMSKQMDMQSLCLPIHLKEMVTDEMPTAYDLDGVLKELREKTELAYRRYMDCPVESPCYVRYQTQYYERRACLEIVEGGRKGEV